MSHNSHFGLVPSPLKHQGDFFLKREYIDIPCNLFDQDYLLEHHYDDHELVIAILMSPSDYKSDSISWF